MSWNDSTEPEASQDEFYLHRINPCPAIPCLANSVDPDQLASELLKKPTDLDLYRLPLSM